MSWNPLYFGWSKVVVFDTWCSSNFGKLILKVLWHLRKWNDANQSWRCLFWPKSTPSPYQDCLSCCLTIFSLVAYQAISDGLRHEIWLGKKPEKLEYDSIENRKHHQSYQRCQSTRPPGQVENILRNWWNILQSWGKGKSCKLSAGIIPDNIFLPNICLGKDDDSSDFGPIICPYLGNFSEERYFLQPWIHRIYPMLFCSKGWYFHSRKLQFVW